MSKISLDKKSAGKISPSFTLKAWWFYEPCLKALITWLHSYGWYRTSLIVMNKVWPLIRIFFLARMVFLQAVSTVLKAGQSGSTLLTFPVLPSGNVFETAVHLTHISCSDPGNTASSVFSSDAYQEDRQLARHGRHRVGWCRSCETPIVSLFPSKTRVTVGGAKSG